MKNLYLIIDYKGRYETKYTANPYRSGMDKDLLRKYFTEYGYQINFLIFPEIDFRDKGIKKKIYLYCSSEDNDGHYKSYIEDIIYGLEIAGARVIPDYKYLRSHHNKVFMEILRDLSLIQDNQNIISKHFGTVEELETSINNQNNINYVLKPAQGAMSKGISFSSNAKELICNVKNISRTKNLWEEIKDRYRVIKYQGYIPESKYRKKFIIQNKIQYLKGDWKVLIYGDKYYVLGRKNRKNDFRASGGGILSYEESLPKGLLDFAKRAYKSIKSPNISLDIGFDEKDFYLIEFQVLYFGTYTIEKSDFYFIEKDKKWELVNGKSILEREYARSITEYINRLSS